MRRVCFDVAKGRADDAAVRANAAIGSDAPPRVAEAASRALSVDDARRLLERPYARARLLSVALLSAARPPRGAREVDPVAAAAAASDAVARLASARVAGRLERLELDALGCGPAEVAQGVLEAVARSPLVAPGGLAALRILRDGAVAPVRLTLPLGSVARLDASVWLDGPMTDEPLPPVILEGRFERTRRLRALAERGARFERLLVVGGMYLGQVPNDYDEESAREAVALLVPRERSSPPFDIEFHPWYFPIGGWARGLEGVRKLLLARSCLSADGIEAIAGLASLEYLELADCGFGDDVDPGRLAGSLARIPRVRMLGARWSADFCDPRLKTLFAALAARGGETLRRVEIGYSRPFFASFAELGKSFRAAAREYVEARQRALAEPWVA